MFAMGPAFFQKATSGYATLALSGAYAAATIGAAYSSDLPISGGNGVYSNPRVTVGTLPSWATLSIVGSPGAYKLELSGTPTGSATTVNITVAVDSGDGQTATSAQSITVGAAGDAFWSQVVSSVPARATTTSAAAADTKGPIVWSASSDPGTPNVKVKTVGSIGTGSLMNFGTGDCTFEWSNSWDNGFIRYQTAFSYGYVSTGALLVQTATPSTGAYAVYMGGALMLTESSAPPTGATMQRYRLVIANMTVGGVTQRYATLYRNGVKTGQSTAALPSINQPTPGAFYWGYDPAHSTANLAGYLSDMRITAAARSYGDYTLEPVPYPTS